MSTLRRFLLLTLAATALLPLSLTLAHDRGHADDQQVTIYGHRGAAGYRPEHTIAPTASPRGWARTTSSTAKAARDGE
jgi:hypothetical protein